MINLLSAFHDALGHELDPKAPPRAKELAFALVSLQQIEVLIELWGLHAQKKNIIANAFDPIIAIEGLKYVAHSIIFQRYMTVVSLHGCFLVN